MQIHKINPSGKDFEVLRAIRQEVFVVEQEVDPREEFDEFELSCTHFLVRFDDTPAATCRYRKTDKGTKLERFAVRKQFRRMGAGSIMVQACLQELNKDQKIYLHAQVEAMPLYAANGFEAYGDLFYECDIPHYAMHWTGNSE